MIADARGVALWADDTGTHPLTAEKLWAMLLIGLLVCLDRKLLVFLFMSNSTK